MQRKALISARRRMNLTQVSLAEKVGISQNSVSQIEKGIRTPSMNVAVKLCNILGISLDVFVNDFKDKNCL